MPIYEYQCTNCHKQFDLLQKITEEPVTQCPDCLKNTAIRLVSAAGFQLKGSGWYATDFKNKPGDNKKKDTGDKSDSPAAEKTTAATPETTASTTTSSSKGDKD